jgi:hypothetical protein
MRTSENSGTLMKIVAEIQHAIDPVVKNKTVEVAGEKAKWSSTYATLGTLAKAITPLLKLHKVAKVQGVTASPMGPMLTTRLQVGDEWIEADYPIKQTRDGSQGFGGGISFAKRWAICGIFDIVPDDVEEGQGYQDARAASRTPRRAAAPGGIGALLRTITDASADTIEEAAQRARAAQPIGEAGASVQREIAAWFTNAFDNAATLDELTHLRDLANRIKPHGSDIRAAIANAARRLEPPR